MSLAGRPWLALPPAPRAWPTRSAGERPQGRPCEPAGPGAQGASRAAGVGLSARAAPEPPPGERGPGTLPSAPGCPAAPARTPGGSPRAGCRAGARPHSPARSRSLPRLSPGPRLSRPWRCPGSPRGPAPKAAPDFASTFLPPRPLRRGLRVPTPHRQAHTGMCTDTHTCTDTLSWHIHASTRTETQHTHAHTPPCGTQLVVPRAHHVCRVLWGEGSPQLPGRRLSLAREVPPPRQRTSPAAKDPDLGGCPRPSRRARSRRPAQLGWRGLQLMCLFACGGASAQAPR